MDSTILSMKEITENQAFALASLSLAGAAHGHLVWKRVSEMRGSPVKIVGLYKSLHGLEERGLIEGVWEDQPEEEYGRPRRRTYRITTDGKRVLSEFAQSQMRVARTFKGWARQRAK
jgi:DNA-binding PadR family transcriptional regulator